MWFCVIRTYMKLKDLLLRRSWVFVLPRNRWVAHLRHCLPLWCQLVICKSLCISVTSSSVQHCFNWLIERKLLPAPAHAHTDTNASSPAATGLPPTQTHTDNSELTPGLAWCQNHNVSFARRQVSISSGCVWLMIHGITVAEVWKRVCESVGLVMLNGSRKS